MSIKFDHTIVPSSDKEISAKFYEDSSSWSQGSHRYAFAMGKSKFERVFSNVKSSGIPYGDSYDKPGNMKGPDKKAPSAKGKGKTIYFREPSDNLLQIITY